MKAILTKNWQQTLSKDLNLNYWSDLSMKREKNANSVHSWTDGEKQSSADCTETCPSNGILLSHQCDFFQCRDIWSIRDKVSLDDNIWPSFLSYIWTQIVSLITLTLLTQSYFAFKWIVSLFLLKVLWEHFRSDGFTLQAGIAASSPHLSVHPTMTVFLGKHRFLAFFQFKASTLRLKLMSSSFHCVCDSDLVYI